MLTTYFLKCITEDIFKHQEMPRVPLDYYIALSSTPPNVDGTGVTEPASSKGYARVQVDNSIISFGEANGNGIVTNNTKVYFPESSASWDNIKYYAIFDDETEGNLLAFGEFSEILNIPIHTMVSIPVGALTMKAENKNAI